VALPLTTRLALAATLVAAPLLAQQAASPQTAPAPPPLVTVRPIPPPKHPLPPEEKSAREQRFSFLVYGDTRSGAVGDGQVIHPIHSQLMDAMLTVVKARRGGDFPVRFVLQTGDAVLRGGDGRMWNVSYSPVIDRLTRGADIPYFLTAGNHDVFPTRAQGLHNLLAAMSQLIPPEGSPRRLNGYPTYAFGYGTVFVIAFDSNIADDPVQLAWVTDQLEHLDRARFPVVVAFMHHPVYSSGPHAVPMAEAATLALRTRYMPLFRRHHVRLLATGHEHFYEHWVERYTDAGVEYRIDELVTGGGGAPTYTYRGEPDLSTYLAAGAAQRVRVEHLVKPGRTIAENPNHFVIIDVDGDRLTAEIVTASGTPFAPFGGRSRIALW
jgi:3',5'-cyclic AMP phosphodiesterase CpdA